MGRGVIIIGGIVFLVVIALVAFFSSRGNQSAAPQDVTLEIWSPFDEERIYKDVLTAYTESNPQTKVKFRHIRADNAKDYEARVVDAIASGGGPDIWLVRTDWLSKHESKLLPASTLTDWATQKNQTSEDAQKLQLSEAIYNHNSLNSQLLGVPLAVDNLALYINTQVVTKAQNELFEAEDKRSELLYNPPATWTQLEEWVRAVTKKQGDKIERSALALGTATNTYAAVDVYSALLTQKGGSIYSSEGEPSLHVGGTNSSVPAKDALELFTSFALPGNSNYSWNANQGDPIKAFAEGKTAMLIGYSTVQQQLTRLNKDFFDYKMAPLPQQSEVLLPTDERVDFAAYWTHVVPKTSAYPEKAWDILRYFSSTDQPSQIYEKSTLKLSLTSARQYEEKPKTSTSGDSSVFLAQVKTSVVAHKLDWQFADEVIQEMVNRVVVQGQSLQTALDTATESLKRGR